MAKLMTMNRIFVLCVATIAMSLPWGESTSTRPVAQGPDAVEKWFEELPHAKEKMTKLHFYFHDVVSGKNPTAVQVAKPKNAPSNSLPTDFGAISVIDDPLTVGPKPDSKLIGRAQGTYNSVSQEGIGLMMVLNYVFTDGIYNGSTLSVLGHNSILSQYREMPILGGTGYFRLARGIATAQTYFFNRTSLDAIVEYNLVVLHY